MIHKRLLARGRTHVFCPVNPRTLGRVEHVFNHWGVIIRVLPRRRCLLRSRLTSSYQASSACVLTSWSTWINVVVVELTSPSILRCCGSESVEQHIPVLLMLCIAVGIIIHCCLIIIIIIACWTLVISWSRPFVHNGWDLSHYVRLLRWLLGPSWESSRHQVCGG